MISFKNNLPDMKFQYEEIVSFMFNNEIKIGTIIVCDYGGSFEHDYHSYDILVENDKESCIYNILKK